MSWELMLGCCAVCAVAGFIAGALFVMRFHIENIIADGVIVYRGSRYKVDLIGRKPKAKT